MGMINLSHVLQPHFDDLKISTVNQFYKINQMSITSGSII